MISSRVSAVRLPDVVGEVRVLVDDLRIEEFDLAALHRIDEHLDVVEALDEERPEIVRVAWHGVPKYRRRGGCRPAITLDLGNERVTESRRSGADGLLSNAAQY